MTAPVTTRWRSVLELFSIGIGPSSSHTVGPMRAGGRFARSLPGTVTRIQVELLGSLGATGPGHGTPDAVIAGLRGLDPATCDPADIRGGWERLGQNGTVVLPGGNSVAMAADDVVLLPRTRLPYHPNALRMRAFRGDDSILERVFYSIGGGTVVEEDADPESADGTAAEDLPHPHECAEELLAVCASTGLDIAQVSAANATARHGRAAVTAGLRSRWAAMESCITAGLDGRGVLPGGLQVRRRAATLASALRADGVAPSDTAWLQVYALAVSEENAAGNRVVTAPTNGAAGIVPAVLQYHLSAGGRRADVTPFLFTASAIGSIVARNASISGAEVGCQGEVGSAAAMAAAGYCAVLGGSPRAVSTAAEIALEHHLGLTCDPVAGLVQIPCIERNAIAAGTAVAAARLALRGSDHPVVSLDVVIETMRRTGQDMSHRYKETSQAGLAVTVPYC